MVSFSQTQFFLNFSRNFFDQRDLIEPSVKLFQLKFPTTRAETVFFNSREFYFFKMLSVWPKIIDWFKNVLKKKVPRRFSYFLHLSVCVCVREFRKMFLHGKQQFFLFVAASARLGAMYHCRHCAFLSWAARLVAVNLHTISGLGCLERKRTPSRNEKLVHGKESYIIDAVLLFTSVIKCHYQVFFLRPPNRVFFVYCYFNGCFNIK